MSARIAEFNAWRTARAHLSAQVEAGVDTKQATAAQAEERLAEVEARLKELEPQVRALPEAAYLFGGKPRRTSKASVRPGGRTPVPPPQSEDTSNTTTPKEGTSMAKKSNAAVLEETLVSLRKAEKSAGTTKWALSGAGAKKNPPSKERKAQLTEKLAKEQALIAELRAKRDELKAKVKA